MTRLCAPVPSRLRTSLCVLACACACARCISVRAWVSVRLRLCCLIVRVLVRVLVCQGAMGAAVAATRATRVPCGCPGESWDALALSVVQCVRGRALSLLATLSLFAGYLHLTLSLFAGSVLALSLFVLCPSWILLDRSGDSRSIRVCPLLCCWLRSRFAGCSL